MDNKLYSIPQMFCFVLVWYLSLFFSFSLSLCLSVSLSLCLSVRLPLVITRQFPGGDSAESWNYEALKTIIRHYIEGSRTLWRGFYLLFQVSAKSLPSLSLWLSRKCAKKSTHFGAKTNKTKKKLLGNITSQPVIISKYAGFFDFIPLYHLNYLNSANSFQ